MDTETVECPDEGDDEDEFWMTSIHFNVVLCLDEFAPNEAIAQKALALCTDQFSKPFSFGRQGLQLRTRMGKTDIPHQTILLAREMTLDIER